MLIYYLSSAGDFLFHYETENQAAIRSSDIADMKSPQQIIVITLRAFLSKP